MTLCIGGPMDGQDYAEQAWQRERGCFEVYVPQRMTSIFEDMGDPSPSVPCAEILRYTRYSVRHSWDGVTLQTYSLWLAPHVIACASPDFGRDPSIEVLMPDGERRWYRYFPDGRIVREGWDVGQYSDGRIRHAGRSSFLYFLDPASFGREQSDPTPETVGYDPFVESDKTLEESLALIAQIRARREQET